MIRRCYVILCLLMFFLTINSQTVNQLIRVGNKQYSQKDYVHAEISYRKVLNKDNNNIVACYNLARTLQAQNKDSEAKILYEKVIKLKEASSARVSSYYNLGTLLQKEKNYGGAIETYKNVLRIDPNAKNSNNKKRSILLVGEINLIIIKRKIRKGMVIIKMENRIRQRIVIV